jgi:hypothetical protein
MMWGSPSEPSLSVLSWAEFACVPGARWQP